MGLFLWGNRLKHLPPELMTAVVWRFEYVGIKNILCIRLIQQVLRSLNIEVAREESSHLIKRQHKDHGMAIDGMRFTTPPLESVSTRFETRAKHFQLDLVITDINHPGIGTHSLSDLSQHFG